MADLEYTIKTHADNEAAKQTADALRDTNKAAAEGVKPTQELHEETKKLNEQKKGLILNLKALAHEIPGVSEAWHLLRHPIIAAGVAIAEVIKLYKDYTHQVEEAAKAVEPFERISAILTGYRAVAAQATGETEEFARALKKIVDSSDTAESRFTKLTDAIAAQIQKSDALRTARINLAKSQVQLDAAEDKISPIEASRRTAALDIAGGSGDRASQARLAGLQYGALLARVSQTQAEQGAATGQGPALAESVSAARKKQIDVNNLADATIKFATDKIALLQAQPKEITKDLATGATSSATFPEVERDIQQQRQEIENANTLKIRAAQATKAAEDAQADNAQKIVARQKTLLELNDARLAKARELDALDQQNRVVGGLENQRVATDARTRQVTEFRRAQSELPGVAREIQAGIVNNTDISALVTKFNDLKQIMADFVNATTNLVNSAHRRLDNAQ